MKFTPKSENEIASENLIQPGTYDFEIVDAENALSKNNNEMVKLKLHVFDDNGNARIVFDYLLESMAYKLRHAADACRLLDKYETGHLIAEDFKGKTGKLKLAIQKSKDPLYADKNVVADYVKRESAADSAPQAKPEKQVAADLDDEIPF